MADNNSAPLSDLEASPADSATVVDLQARQEARRSDAGQAHCMTGAPGPRTNAAPDDGGSEGDGDPEAAGLRETVEALALAAAHKGRADPDDLSAANFVTVCDVLLAHPDRIDEKTRRLAARGRRMPQTLLSDAVRHCCRVVAEWGDAEQSTEGLSEDAAPVPRHPQTPTGPTPASEAPRPRDGRRSEWLARIVHEAGAPDGRAVESIETERLRLCALRMPRTHDPARLAELAASVRDKGVLQPLIVRPAGQGYEIVAGERRWLAARALGRRRVPATVLTLSDQEVLEVALVENLQRRDLDPIEEAEGYRQLIETYGLDQEVLARAVGKSRSHICHMLRLLRLPHHAQHLLREGRVSAGHARAALAAEDPGALVVRAADQGLTVREVERLARAEPRRPASARRADRPAEHPRRAALQDRLAQLTGRPAQLRLDAAGHGKLTLEVDIALIESLIRTLEGDAAS